MRRTIEHNSPELAGRIKVYGAGEDWDGLRDLVAASSMPGRDEVLRIIDTVPVWDAANRRGRESELMRLDGGDVYRDMVKILFPELREATFIIVYYRNKTQQ
jgi:hypothetical protein